MLTDLILPMFHMQPPLKSSEVSLDLRADTILDRLPPFVRNKKEVIECCTSSVSAGTSAKHTMGNSQAHCT